MLTRRGLILGGCCSIVMLESGCLLFLLRLGVRGSALRGASRAARYSRAATLATVGRGIGVTSHSLRAINSANRLARLNSRVLRQEDDEDVAVINGDDEIIECRAEFGELITSSVRDGSYLQHRNHLLGEYCGNSVHIDEKTIEHRAPPKRRGSPERKVGWDVVESDLVHHYDEDRNLVGSSSVKQRSSERWDLEAEGLSADMRTVLDASRLGDPEMAEKARELSRQVEACFRHSINCDGQSLRIARYLQQLEASR